MKKILYLPLAVFALALGSCSNEDDFGGKSAVQGNDVISAVTPSKDTRTSMSGNSVLWDEDDIIGVISTKGGNENVNTPYYLQDGAGTGSASFLGLSTDGYTKAVAYYPYNKTVTYTENELLLTLPEIYEYSADSPSSNNKAPMAGLIGASSQSEISFKNAGALVQIDLQKIPAKCTSIKLISGNDDPKLAGAAKITFDNEEIPTLTMADANAAQNQVQEDATAVSEGHTITINFTNEGEGTNKSFYFPLPIANYSSLAVCVEGVDGFKSQTLKEKELKAERGVRHTTTLTFDALTGSIPTEVTSVDDIKNALAETNAVIVAEVKDGSSSGGQTDPEIALPKVGAEAVTAKSVSIAFDKISTEKTIIIKEDTGETGDGAVAKEVNIAVPPVVSTGTGEDSKAPKVAVDLPNSTVTLSANGETATFAEVTAKTAENTLVVNNGVIITKLTVKKGNVRLKGDAKITELVNNTGGKIKLYVEDAENASYPSDLGIRNVIVIKSPEDELAATAVNGGTYTLETDLTGDFVVSATKPVIIELNGHKITNKSGDTFTVNMGSTLTINGNGTVDNVTHGKACIYNNGTVTLDGGEYTRSKETGASTTVSGGNSYYNILNHGVMTINAGVKVISSGAYSSLIANGYYSYIPKSGETPDARGNYISETNHANPSLTINGGTFSGGINTIKNDDGANLTIANGTFTNTTQATVQNNHIATISGGTFTPKGIATHVVESRYGDAIYDLGQTTINGGTFNGQLYLSGESPSLTISGGTFSDPHALDYLSSGATVDVCLLADTELAKSVVMTKGTATFDLQKHTLTAAADAKVSGTSYSGNVAIAVKDSAKLTVENGSIGNSSNGLLYGVYAFGTGDVTLDNVLFSERITYAYGGAGKLAATGCTFKGWLSGWHHGGTFTNCTFTIGKNWYPATICYGNTTFNICKFFNNGTDADEYDGKGPDSNGYYRCNYVVAGCNPATTIGFTSCKFMNENGTLTDISKNNHPYHACGGWGDGKTPDANITVDGNVVTTKCSKASNAAQ